MGSDLQFPWSRHTDFVPREFLEGLPIRRLWGVGEKTANLLEGWGIKTIGQVARMPMEGLEEKLGNWGRQLYFLARGIDDRPVVPYHQVKSIGHGAGRYLAIHPFNRGHGVQVLPQG
ncbi:MAG: DNA polymerase thumb domain-containing protein [Thermincolia bacterium]